MQDNADYAEVKSHSKDSLSPRLMARQKKQSNQASKQHRYLWSFQRRESG